MAVTSGGMQDEGSLENRFGYHQPTNGSIVAQHQAVRHASQALAEAITQLVPPSREQTVAIGKIEEAMFWANAGIARISNYREQP